MTLFYSCVLCKPCLLTLQQVFDVLPVLYAHYWTSLSSLLLIIKSLTIIVIIIIMLEWPCPERLFTVVPHALIAFLLVLSWFLVSYFIGIRWNILFLQVVCGSPWSLLVLFVFTYIYTHTTKFIAKIVKNESEALAQSD